MNNNRATIGDLIEALKAFPTDTPITIIEHEDDGHWIDFNPATKDDIDWINLENGELRIGF